MPAHPPPLTAALLLIGNELLSGKVQEANLLVLARELRGLGVRLVRTNMIEDRVEVIEAEVRALAQSHDWVFTSGGVGPTHDDVTVEGVARAFGLRLERRSELVELLHAFYASRCTEGHLRMADVPEGTELVDAQESWPAILVRNVFVLPGIPQVFARKLSAVRARLAIAGARPFVSRAVLTDMDEGHLKHLLDAVVARFPEVEVGSYPAWYGAPYRTKLTFDGLDPELVEAARDAFVATLPEGERRQFE